MMHGKTKKEIITFAQETARRFNFSQEILFTEQELKKEKLNLRGILR